VSNTTLPSGFDAAEALRLMSLALQHEADDQQAWVEAECDGRPALREAVLALLEAERASTGFLESGPEVAALIDRKGERLGAFEIVEEVALGGMSAVYRGRRVDGTFDHQVAIKLFDAHALSADGRTRFQTERRILALLDHPGIARIIDGGATRDGTPYLVMEWVEGEPISRYCNRHGLGLPERVALVVQVCEALAMAHRQGIAHRDIKPGNVLVDERGQPRLIDFGIAKVLDSASVEMELPETRQGQSLMTPEYASPEQIAGRPVTIATDVYSMGVLLYELLTGSRPHQLAGLSLVEMERLVMGTVPADPSHRVLQRRAAPPEGLGEARQLGRRLRGDIDRIVMTAMRLEPEQRYVTIKAFADDLERYLSGKPVAARGASSLYRASRFVARHRTGVAATVAAFLMLAMVSGLALHQASEARAQRDLVEVEARRAVAARDFLIDMIKRADPFENADSPTLAGALRQALPDLDRNFAGQPELEARLRYAVGYALQNLGEIDVARDQFERALELRRDAAAAERAEVHDGLAIVAWWESDFDKAATSFERALAVLGETDAELSDSARKLRVTVLANWSAMLIDVGDFARSEELALHALEASDEDPSLDPETLASIWSTIATSREGLHRKQEALAAFQRSLEIQREATGEMHPSYALVLNNLALLYYSMDRLGDAISAMSESVRIRRATLGDRHPQTATALFNLARLQTLAGDLDTAEALAEEALSVALEGYPSGHPRIGKAHEALAIVLEARGEYAAALRQITTAVSIYRNAEGVDPAWIENAGGIGDRIVQLMRGERKGGTPGTPP